MCPSSWLNFQGDCTSDTGKGECAPNTGAATCGTRRRRRAPDQMTQCDTQKTAYAVPAGPAGQMDSPGHPAESRARLRGQHHGGSTKHRRRGRVRTVPEMLPQAMQAWGKSRPACAHCRPLHAPNSRRKQNLRHAVSGQGGKDVAKCPRDPQKDPGKERGSNKGKQPHRQKKSHQRCSDLPIWGRTRSSAMTNVT